MKKLLIGLTIVVAIVVGLYVKNCLCLKPSLQNCYCSDHYITESYN